MRMFIPINQKKPYQGKGLWQKKKKKKEATIGLLSKSPRQKLGSGWKFNAEELWGGINHIGENKER